jgi:hypothetical protein
MMPLHIRPALSTYAVDWRGPCDNTNAGCTDPDAHWFQNPKGTGLEAPIVVCPTCSPSEVAWM